MRVRAAGQTGGDVSTGRRGRVRLRGPLVLPRVKCYICIVVFLLVTKEPLLKPRRPAVVLVALVAVVLALPSVAVAAVNTTASQGVQAGSGNATGYAVAALADGSSIVAGYFEDDITFGDTSLTGLAGVDEAFVAKANADGSWAWATQATQAGGAGGDAIRGIAALADGSAIVVGSFQGQTTFGSTTLTSSGSADNIFVAKIGATGQWVWARAVTDGGTQTDVARGVTVLADGSAIVSGFFRGSPNFSPGPGVVSSPRRDAFVAKIAADGSTWEWVTVAGGSGDDQAFGVSALSDGSAIVAGSFVNAVSFGSTTLTSAGSEDAFVAKVSAAGAWQWAVRGGGTGTDRAYAASVLADGSALATGSFDGTATFGSTMLVTVNGGAFVGKTTSSGSWDWATKAEDSVAATGVAIAAKSDGSAIFAGSIQGAASFGSITLTATGARDAVVAGISAAGQWQWAQQAGDSAFAEGRGVAAFPDRSFAVTGDFQSAVTFGPRTLTSSGASDVFLARYAEEPDPPTSVMATAGDGHAAVTWTAPAVTGGSPITRYTVTSSPGGHTCVWTTGPLACAVTGLTNGTAYTFTVTATNVAGTSAPSAASASITPNATPKSVASLQARILAPRGRLVSGETIRVGIRVTNSGNADATAVVACLRVPAMLTFVNTRSGTQSGRIVCFRIDRIAADKKATRFITVRAVGGKRIEGTITGSVRAADVKRTRATSRAVVVTPRPVVPEPVTG